MPRENLQLYRCQYRAPIGLRLTVIGRQVCWIQADAWVVQASATVPVGQQEVTLVFDGAQISASSAVAPLRLARVQAKCQVRGRRVEGAIRQQPAAPDPILAERVHDRAAGPPGNADRAK